MCSFATMSGYLLRKLIFATVANSEGGYLLLLVGICYNSKYGVGICYAKVHIFHCSKYAQGVFLTVAITLLLRYVFHRDFLWISCKMYSHATINLN